MLQQLLTSRSSYILFGNAEVLQVFVKFVKWLLLFRLLLRSSSKVACQNS
jgi:hypothetical protein